MMRTHAHERREIDRDVPLSADWKTVYRAMAADLNEEDR